MDLCEDSDSFYFSDRKVGDDTYRVFSYRLASWTDMQKPNAKNCRGTTFLLPKYLVEPNESNTGLVSLPPEKFFNYEEGNQDHTQHKIGVVMNKLDGSLISTVFTVDDEVLLKSKTSFESDQVIAATKWLNEPEQVDFKRTIKSLDMAGYTVNMEWTSPENRIVVPYQESKLTILNVRDNVGTAAGTTYYGEELRKKIYIHGGFFSILWMVDYRYNAKNHDIIDQMKKETEGEGYVVEIQDPNGSYLVKVKNHKYLSLHKTKDSINTPTKLFEAVIMEYSDDMRGLFADDAYSLAKINEMEAEVIPIFNQLVNNVELFYESSKHLDRKNYAIDAKSELPELMSLCMNLYLGKENDYKAFALKHADDIFGITNMITTFVE